MTKAQKNRYDKLMKLSPKIIKPWAKDLSFTTFSMLLEIRKSMGAKEFDRLNKAKANKGLGVILDYLATGKPNITRILTRQ